MDKASEVILALKPVTFRYKKELDPDGIPQFGLVAEEVEKANPDLVLRDAAGKPYTVRYEAVNAMLLNEFLKEHRKVGGTAATVAGLHIYCRKARGDQCGVKGNNRAAGERAFSPSSRKKKSKIAALTSGLQKVSAQIADSELRPART